LEQAMNFLTSPLKTFSILKALDKSQAIIEFDTEGIILNANQNFLNLMSYNLHEIKGLHHQIFVDENEVKSESYKKFWEDLKSGMIHSSEFKRLDKNKKAVWIEASYNPVFGITGSLNKIIKFATDITHKKNQSADSQGQLLAINRSHAVISFSIDGLILDANANFLKIFDYKLEEIKGKHHSIFVEESYKNSIEYKNFWEELNRGSYHTSEFKRFGKNKKQIWIQSTYNPIFQSDGKILKIVKFASDITSYVEERNRRKEIQIFINEDINKINNSVHIATQKTLSASNASSNTSVMVQAIAAGAEELDASVIEIKNQVENAKNISNQAVIQSQETGITISNLTNSSKKIGEIINLINEIADQTNLLSLNASIEAARAGDSGRGFAVVASEVKNLADQTSIATKEISQQIKSVQNFTQKAVKAIEDIFQTISNISEISSIISSAVEEQSVVTKEMAQNMTIAANNVETINSSISEISDTANQIRNIALQVKEASSSIA
jgi:methyl-accepting chemotaxis protein